MAASVNFLLLFICLVILFALRQKQRSRNLQALDDVHHLPAPVCFCSRIFSISFLGVALLDWTVIELSSPIPTAIAVFEIIPAFSFLPTPSTHISNMMNGSNLNLCHVILAL